MAFTVNDLQDLIALLAEKPEWRAQLRPVILGDDFERLPGIVAQLAEAQRRTEERLAQLGATVEALGDKVDRLAETVIGLRDRLDEDTGALYEIRFDRKAPSLFGRWLRRPTVVTLNDLTKVDAAETAGELSGEEAEALRELDLIVAGRDKDEAGMPETLLAVEISRTLDIGNIDRAVARAALLTRVGYRARPAVGGKIAPERVREAAAREGVILRLLDRA